MLNVFFILKIIAVIIFIIDNIIFIREERLNILKARKIKVKEFHALIERNRLEPALLKIGQRHCGFIHQRGGIIGIQQLPFLILKRGNNCHEALAECRLLHGIVHALFIEPALNCPGENFRYRIIIYII